MERNNQIRYLFHDFSSNIWEFYLFYIFLVEKYPTFAFGQIFCQPTKFWSVAEALGILDEQLLD